MVRLTSREREATMELPAQLRRHRNQQLQEELGPAGKLLC